MPGYIPRPCVLGNMMQQLGRHLRGPACPCFQRSSNLLHPWTSMPELAEVEFYRKRWHLAAAGQRVIEVLTHDTKKLLRELDLPAFRHALTGAKLLSSEAAAKQMLFRFSGNVWLGIHLGMSGELT